MTGQSGHSPSATQSPLPGFPFSQGKQLTPGSTWSLHLPRNNLQGTSNICSKGEGRTPPTPAQAAEKPHPAVLVPVDDLGWDGFGVACLGPHLLPESVVLGDIHQLVLDVLPIKDSGYFALLGFDLEAGWEKQVMGRWRGAPRAGTHPACQPGSAQPGGWVWGQMGTAQREQGRGHRARGGRGRLCCCTERRHPPPGTETPELTSREPVTDVL